MVGEARYLAILTVRNEGSFLLEWLAHARALGFTDIIACSNDCDDGTDAMLDRLQAMGMLVHLPNPGPHPKGAHFGALERAAAHPLYPAADWAMVFDIDEFPVIHTGGHRLRDLTAALPDAEAIALTWKMFGNGGVVDLADRPVTETFTRCAPPVLFWPWRAQMFKTLYRPRAFGKPGIHRPRGADKGQRWFDGAGRPIPGGPGRIFSPLGQDNTTLAQVNHYALGSMEGYLVKCERGRANRDAAGFDLGYWVERNFARDEDTTIRALDSRAIRDDLRADPVLGPLHAQAFAWRKARFHALMEEEPWRALFGRLLLAPPTRVLSEAEARLVWQHAVRAAKGNNPA